MLKILICGSRNWQDEKHIEETLKVSMIFSRLWKKELVLIHGGARGVDSIAGKIAKKFKIKTKVFPAQWDKFGRQAGFRRNVEMIEYKPDLVVAFWDGKSVGTKHTIDLAKKKDIRCVVHKEEKNEKD